MAWPTGVASDTELVVAVNNFSGSLNGAIDAVTTTVVLVDASALPSTGGYVTIGTEAIKFTGKSTNTLTGVTRGADGTTAASHSNGSAVLGFIVAAHHNLLKDEIKAIETSLDLTASRAVVTSASGRVTAATTTAAEIGHVNGVTSAIQTQLDAKAPIASPSFTGTVTLPTGLTGVLRADSGVVSTDSDVTDIVAAASDSAAGKLEIADQSEMEAGSSATLAVTPGRQHFHPAACKAWVEFNGSGTVAIAASYNVSSITDNGTGDYTVNFTTAFSSGNYCMTGMGRRPASTPDAVVCLNRAASPVAGACRLATTNGAGTHEDFDIVAAAFFGDL